MIGYDIHNAMRRAYGFPDEPTSDDFEVFDYGGGFARLQRLLVLLAVSMKGWV